MQFNADLNPDPKYCVPVSVSVHDHSYGTVKLENMFRYV
jgi:hypothetical protein